MENVLWNYWYSSDNTNIKSIIFAQLWQEFPLNYDVDKNTWDTCMPSSLTWLSLALKLELRWQIKLVRKSEVGDLTCGMERMAWLRRNEKEKETLVVVPYLMDPLQSSAPNHEVSMINEKLGKHEWWQNVRWKPEVAWERRLQEQE